MAYQRQSASNNEAWTHVERRKKLNDKGNLQDYWKCKYCSEEKIGNVGRVEAHLGDVPRLGIAGCKGNVPPEVRARMALAANQKKENKKRKCIAASDNPMNYASKFGNSYPNDNLFQFDHLNSVFGPGSSPLNPNGEIGSSGSGLAGQQPLPNQVNIHLFQFPDLETNFGLGSYPPNPSGEAGNSSRNTTLQQPPLDNGLSMALSGKGMSTQRSSLCEIEGSNLAVLQDASPEGSNSTSLLSPVSWRKGLKRKHSYVSCEDWERDEQNKSFDKLCANFFEAAEIASESPEKCEFQIDDAKKKLKDDSIWKNKKNLISDGNELSIEMSSNGCPPSKTKESKVDQLMKEKGKKVDSSNLWSMDGQNESFTHLLQDDGLLSQMGFFYLSGEEGNSLLF